MKYIIYERQDHGELQHLFDDETKARQKYKELMSRKDTDQTYIRLVCLEIQDDNKI